MYTTHIKKEKIMNTLARMTLNFSVSCAYLLRAGITGVNHQTWLGN